MTSWLVELLGLLTVVVCSQSNKLGIAVKPLHQGLLIEKHGGLYYQTAEWVVLMTITSPPPTEKITVFAKVLKEEIQKVSSRFPQLAENWNSRLDWCVNIVQHFPASRNKRAPLGFIGRLSHTLFGTVTEEELQQYRNIILDNKNSLNSTIHRTNLLLSATKSNRQGINKNMEHINRVQRYLVSLRHTITKNFQITSDSISMISIRIKIEHALVSLEQSTHRILAYINHRKRQMNSVYRHALSEDLLSRSQLQEIIQKASSLRLATMPLEWYYQFCHVVPVWSTVDDITFKVHLPLHDGQNYIMYVLNSFPFPVKSGFHTKVRVRNRIAYSSSAGLLFEPILCLGTELKVCRGGALYDTARFRCERALISRDAAGTKHCEVRVYSTNRTVIKEDSPGLYIVSTPEIHPKLHCQARGEETIKLTSGVYMISLNHSCTLRGEDWTLPGLRKITTPFHISNQIAPISLRTAFAPLPISSLQTLAAVPSWTPIHELAQIKLEPLAPPSRLLSLPALNTATWINSGAIIAILLVAVILFIAARMWKKYKGSPKPLLKKFPSAPTEMELQPRTTGTAENPPSTVILPLYPTLRQEESL